MINEEIQKQYIKNTLQVHQAIQTFCISEAFNNAS